MSMRWPMRGPRANPALVAFGKIDLFAQMWESEATEAKNPERAAEAKQLANLTRSYLAGLSAIVNPPAGFKAAFKSEPPATEPQFAPGDFKTANQHLIDVNRGWLTDAEFLRRRDPIMAGLAREIHAAIVAYYSRWHIPE